jgi:adenosylmethionine-8-amino-7-oxononanoate aminotransferase
MVGIELVRDRDTGSPYPAAWRAGHRARLEARRLGAILWPLGDVLALLPPLAMSEAQLTELAGIAQAALDRATATLDRELSAKVQF